MKTKQQIKEMSREDAIQNLRFDLYGLLCVYAEAREDIDFEGNGHHFAQKLSGEMTNQDIDKLRSIH